MTDQLLPDQGPGAGRRRFIIGAGAAAGATAVSSTLPARVAHARTPSGASRFVPLEVPVRILDTRPKSERSDDRNYPSRVIDANRRRIRIGGLYGVSETASAVVITLTGVNKGAPNFVTAYPSDVARPEASNLNMPVPFDITANLVTVRLSASGELDLFRLADAGLIVDVLGCYEPVDGAVREGRFVGLREAARAFDSRNAYPDRAAGPVGDGGTVVVDVTAQVPDDASSVVINLTATGNVAPGYLTAFAVQAQGPPATSSLNLAVPETTRASAVIVPVTDLGGRRRIKVFALRQTDVIVDVTGYFTGPESAMGTSGLFVPLNPQRVLDTRGMMVAQLGPSGVLWPGWSVEAQLPGEARSSASAIVVNLTAVGSVNPGFLTLGPARHPIPKTSNVNFATPGSTVPNHAITSVTRDAGIQVYAGPAGMPGPYKTAAVLVDYAGYYTGDPLAPVFTARQNPHPPPIGPPWTIEVPIGGRYGEAAPMRHEVIGGPDGDAVVDSGRTWHWQGTALVGQAGHIVVFGHRSEYGAPYWNIHHLVPGNQVHLYTADGRRYTYEMTSRWHTGEENTNIFNAARQEPAPSLSIVACTVGNRYVPNNPEWYLPTWLHARIVVNFRYVGWTMVW